MNCLNCGTEMTNNTVVTKKDRVSYDMCDKCGSLWLDAGELDKMAFQVEGSIEFCEEDKDSEPEKQPLTCPRCKVFKLVKVKFLESDEIFLHHCTDCGGFWLDGGELNLIDQDLTRIMPVRGKGFSDFVNDVHVPYWFKRVKARSNETEGDMQSPPIKGAEELSDTTDICPACGNALRRYSISHMEFEGCPKCKGVWLVKDELRKLKNTVEDGSLHWLNDEIDNIEKTSVVTTNRSCIKCKTTKMVVGYFRPFFGRHRFLSAMPRNVARRRRVRDHFRLPNSRIRARACQGRRKAACRRRKTHCDRRPGEQNGGSWRCCLGYSRADQCHHLRASGAFQIRHRYSSPDIKRRAGFRSACAFSNACRFSLRTLRLLSLR